MSKEQSVFTLRLCFMLNASNAFPVVLANSYGLSPEMTALSLVWELLIILKQVFTIIKAKTMVIPIVKASKNTED